MSDKRYLGNIITQNPTAPAGNFGDSAAKGVWSLEEQLAYQKAGLWPVPGNFPLNVEDVFSTYLYEGNGSTQTITNGIDLDGEGGLVWIKDRSSASNYHSLNDTERGTTKYLSSNRTDAEGTGDLTAFNSNGFDVRYQQTGYINESGGNLASWTFRKAPKFFDVVTYTGNGTAGRTVSHSLGSVPGCIIVKQYQAGEARPWSIYHRGIDASAPEDYRISFTTAARVDDAGQWNDTAPTSTVFTVGDSTYVNNNGESYVAYLFAHNNNDGEFGPDGDADIIKCGSVSYPASGDVEVNLGFEPQWVLYKDVTHSGNNWWILDTMRGWNAQETGGTFSSTTGGNAKALFSDTSGAEVEYDYGALTSTGFKLPSNFNYGDNNTDFIYIAIRRGTAVPTSATEVFDIKTSVNTNPAFTSDHVIDLAMFTHKTSSDNRYWSARLASRGYLFSNAPNAGPTNQAAFDFGDTQFGHYNATGLGTNYLGYFWKRAPNYMDVVAFTGTGSNQNVSHNLTVAPEMMWIKSRDAVHSWASYHVALGNTGIIYLNSNEAAFSLSGATVLNNTTPTSSVFTVGTNNVLNQSTKSYIAYLFASLAGISKVGSVTHSGTTNVDCGFTSGASLVMLKRTDSTGDWYWWDSTSGIIAGNDPYFILNGQAPQVTNTDYIDPLSSGFTITSSFTAGDYIFYAIA